MMYPAERDYALADGPEQVRHVVREQIKYGVDVIKVMATAAFSLWAISPAQSSSLTKK